MQTPPWVAIHRLLMPAADIYKLLFLVCCLQFVFGKIFGDYILALTLQDGLKLC